jgi:hypothetical protein
LLKNVDFFCGDVDEIDLPNRRVRVSHGAPRQDARHSHLLSYDHLILAMGSVASFGTTPGVEEHALTMRTLGDAVTLRNRLIESLEVADSDCFAQMRAPLLTFVIAGGGFSGVETAGAINDFLRDAIKSYRHLSVEKLRVVLVHSGERVLPELGEKLGEYATQKLREHGVEVLLQRRVASADAKCVTLSDGTSIPAHTLIWTVGNAANPLLGGLPCPCERGRVRVDENLEVLEWPGVWALGDGAHALDETLENRIRRPRNTPCGKEKLRQETSSRVCAGKPKRLFASKHSAKWQRLGVARAWQARLVFSFRVFWPGRAPSGQMANGLPFQTAALREKSACGARLDARRIFLQRPGATLNADRRCDRTRFARALRRDTVKALINSPFNMQLQIQPIEAADLDAFLDFCGELYAFDGQTVFDREPVRPAARQLLDNPQLGRAVWLVADGVRAGYLVLSFGWSFEFGGRTAVLEHLFVREEFRRQGIASAANCLGRRALPGRRGGNDLSGC